MYKLLIVIEKSETGYSAYSPDLPGCVATGKTAEEAEKQMYEAVEMHIQGMLEDGLPIPKPNASSVHAIISTPETQTA
ncbi:MAG: type II toxin-antitoxin system HicB family antitoxin [Candidatus Thermoplasmatota archaeon]|nr:type II toxin-antitoxin system HicB family antitoxin [Candidatus Thermoplasmatota archaeon]